MASRLVRREVVAEALESVTPMVHSIRRGIEHAPMGRDPDPEAAREAWAAAEEAATRLDEFRHRLTEGEFDVGAN